MPEHVLWGSDSVQVELQAFNNRQLTRKLQAMYQRIEAVQLSLPVDAYLLELF